MKQVYEIRIAGTPLRVVTEEEEAYVAALADSLSQKVNDIVVNSKNASKLDAALLCALDSMDAAAKAQALARQLKQDNTRLLEKIDRLQKHGKH